MINTVSTKEKLLESAMNLALTNGFNDIKIEDITFKAQVAKGSFYTYFSAKEDIFFEILKKIFEKIEIDLKKIKFEKNLKKDLYKFINFMLKETYYNIIPFKVISNIFTNSEFIKTSITKISNKNIFAEFTENILKNCKSELSEDIEPKLCYISISINSVIEVYVKNIFDITENQKNYNKINEEDLENHINFLVEFLYRAFKK